MNRKARLFNEHHLDLVEEFNGRTVVIPAKPGFVEMDYHDAVLFRGQFKQPKLDAVGRQDPKSVKALRMEADPIDPTGKPLNFVCQMDGKSFNSQPELDAHILANYAEQMLDQDAKEKLTKKKA